MARWRPKKARATKRRASYSVGNCKLNSRISGSRIFAIFYVELDVSSICILKEPSSADQ